MRTIGHSWISIATRIVSITDIGTRAVRNKKVCRPGTRDYGIGPDV